MISRRTLLKGAAAAVLGAAGLGSYAFAVEPRFRLVTTRNEIALPGWPKGHGPLRIVAISDPHFCEPWMPLDRLDAIVDLANGMEPDVIVLLGDYQPGLQHFRTGTYKPAQYVERLERLRARHGVHAILGNHDWWTRPAEVRAAFAGSSINLMENDVVRISRADGDYWIAGTASMIAIPLGRNRYEGRDDLPGTLAKVDGDDPVLLLAHEPDIFVRVPDRVALTLSGHTHGGQVRLPFLGRPVVPSQYGQRFAYGHIVEEGRHLLVSGGLGCSILPVRFGVPPELNEIVIRSSQN